MELLLISKESNKIHISMYGLYSDYTIYNSEGRLIDGGILIGKATGGNVNKLISSVISMAKGVVDFSSPYKTLKDEEAMELIEKLEEQEYQNMINKAKDIEEELEK